MIIQCIQCCSETLPGFNSLFSCCEGNLIFLLIFGRLSWFNPTHSQSPPNPSLWKALGRKYGSMKLLWYKNWLNEYTAYLEGLLYWTSLIFKLQLNLFVQTIENSKIWTGAIFRLFNKHSVIKKSFLPYTMYTNLCTEMPLNSWLDVLWIIT